MHWCGGESGCDSSMRFKESLYEFTVSLDLIHEDLLNIHRNKFFVIFFFSLSLHSLLDIQQGKGS